MFFSTGNQLNILFIKTISFLVGIKKNNIHIYFEVPEKQYKYFIKVLTTLYF